jgi:TonB family protein
MRWRLLITSIITVASPASEAVAPSHLYIVSEFSSDYGPAFYYRLIELNQDGPDSIVRYSRVAAVNLNCPRTIVQSAEARLRGKSPAELIRPINPCAIKPRTLKTALEKYAAHAGVFDTISFGLVAHCGASDATLELPIPEKVDLDRLRRDHPEMADLWNLASVITGAAFGSADIFHDRTDEDELTLQRAGEKIIPELISGRYDAGLAAATRGNVGNWKSPSFRALLESYRGPVSATEAKSTYIPQLVNAPAYRFERYVAPKYPPLAQQARIQGKVELQLTMNWVTGEVLNAFAISGHSLLTPTAIEAAKQWRFEPQSAKSEMLRVTLDYTLRCP